jgi:hypothetical protein
VAHQTVRTKRHPSFVVNDSTGSLEQALLEEREGTRTWTVWAPSREELLQRVTLIFAEHIHDDDEVHIAYNAMQTGWQRHPPNEDDGSTFTELSFEYSALIVTRRHSGPRPRELTDALWALVDRLDRA